MPKCWTGCLLRVPPDKAQGLRKGGNLQKHKNHWQDKLDSTRKGKFGAGKEKEIKKQPPIM